MISNGLLGKVVKTDNYHFIGFLYPNSPFVGGFFVFDSMASKEPDIIYAGKEYITPGYEDFPPFSKDELIKSGIKFISTYSADGKYDIDLTDREAVLDLLYSKWNLDYKQYVDIDMLAVLLMMDEQDFLDFVKIRWLSKKRCEDKNIGLYSNKAIYKLLKKPIEKIYADILSLESDTDLSGIEISLVNAIKRAKAHSYAPNKKDDYNSTLKELDLSIQGHEKEFALIFSKYRNMKHAKKIKLIWLFTELQKLISVRKS